MPISARALTTTDSKTMGLIGIALLPPRSEEHTSELQSRPHLVCRLLLEKKIDSHQRYPLGRLIDHQPRRRAALTRRHAAVGDFHSAHPLHLTLRPAGAGRTRNRAYDCTA